jgi:hypothetical protein
VLEGIETKLCNVVLIIYLGARATDATEVNWESAPLITVYVDSEWLAHASDKQRGIGHHREALQNRKVAQGLSTASLVAPFNKNRSGEG